MSIIIKFILKILASLGIVPPQPQKRGLHKIDPSKVLASMPTVSADEIQFELPTQKSFEGAPQFHEDEWCQIEFFHKDRLGEIQETLHEYKAFEEKHRTKNGWREIYARRIKREIMVFGDNAITDLASSVDGKILPSPILTITSSPLGQVKNGFSLDIATSVLLYGVNDIQGINTLGAKFNSDGDNSKLAFLFIEIYKKYGLIMVDWPAQQILWSVSDDENIRVWNP